MPPNESLLPPGGCTIPNHLPQPLVYKSGGNIGAMIALFLPISTGVRFVQSDPGALPLNELHVTLTYLGKADDLSLGQIKAAHGLMRLISENHPPLTGHINGCGRFCNGDDDGDPFFIIPDLAALPNLRQVIIDGLGSHSIEGAKNHGFVPHITLTYLPHAEYNPFDIIEKTPISFQNISLVLGDDRYDYPLTQGVPLLSSKALIEKIGARHTGVERGTIQKMHDLTLDLGAECHPLTRRAGAKHSHTDRVMVQRMHDDCAGLGAECKALPERDPVYSSQTLKGGPGSGRPKKSLATKAQSDAPNYEPASTPQRCANCRFFLGDPGRDWCDLFDFTADPDYVSDAWEPQRPDEIPGYVANKGVLILRDWENSSPLQRKGRDAVNNAIKAGTLKKANTKKCFRCGNRPGAEYHHVDGYTEGKKLNVRPVCRHCHATLTNKVEANKGDLAALTEGILILRGGRTSGNWGHAGRKGKKGGSGSGGGFGRIGVKPGSKPSRKKVQAAAKKKAKAKSPSKPKVPAKKPAAKPKPQPAVKPVAAKKPAAKKRVAKEDKVPKTDKTAAGDVRDAKATNNKTMSKNSDAWQKNLAAAELDGLQTYQSSEFGNINGSLRGQGKATPANKKAIKSIDKALKKSLLKEDTVVFRSMDEGTLEKLLGPDMKKWTGQSYGDKGYSSTSIDPKGTFGFRGIPMEIRVPKGTPAGYMANLPGGGAISAGEQELLLGRGQKFRILKVKGGRTPKIIAEVIN